MLNAAPRMAVLAEYWATTEALLYMTLPAWAARAPDLEVRSLAIEPAELRDIDIEPRQAAQQASIEVSRDCHPFVSYPPGSRGIPILRRLGEGAGLRAEGRGPAAL